MHDDEPILDAAKIAQLRALDDDDMPEISKEIAQTFLTETPKCFERLLDSVGREDPTAVGNDAHAIKGSAMNFGGLRVSRLAEEIELAGKGGEGTPPQITALGEALDEMYAALCAEFGI